MSSGHEGAVRARTHVVVAHLAALVLVDAEDLALLAAAELEARDVVDDEEDDVGHDRRPRHRRDGRCELPACTSEEERAEELASVERDLGRSRRGPCGARGKRDAPSCS